MRETEHLRAMSQDAELRESMSMKGDLFKNVERLCSKALNTSPRSILVSARTVPASVLRCSMREAHKPTTPATPASLSTLRA